MRAVVSIDGIPIDNVEITMHPENEDRLCRDASSEGPSVGRMCEPGTTAGPQNYVSLAEHNAIVAKMAHNRKAELEYAHRRAEKIQARLNRAESLLRLFVVHVVHED